MLKKKCVQTSRCISFVFAFPHDKIKNRKREKRDSNVNYNEKHFKYFLQVPVGESFMTSLFTVFITIRASVSGLLSN